MTTYSFRDPYIREHRCCARVEAYYSREWVKYDMPPHFHDRVEIMYVLKGTAIIHLYDYQLDGAGENVLIRRHWTERLGAGEYMLVDCKVMHRLEVPDENYMLNVEFALAEDERALVDISRLAAASPELLDLMTRGDGIMRGRDESGRLFREMERVIRELSGAVLRDLALPQVMMAELLLRVAGALKDSAIKGNVLGYARKAADFLAAHLDENIRIGDVARAVGVAPAYLQRVFHQAMDMTIVEYLNRLRIERSRYLLLSTDDPITDVAVAVGFNSRQHFFRVFNALVGMSPQQFRRQQRTWHAQHIFEFENARDYTVDERQGGGRLSRG